jgi:oxalate decarboxylase/phosphoglucose isomerase-like protein (cupin superfamily)
VCAVSTSVFPASKTIVAALVEVNPGPLRFLEMFRSSYYADVSLDQWMAPNESLITDH